MVLSETKLKLYVAFVNTRSSELYLNSYELSGQNVRHLPNCYLVVAPHGQAMLAIVLRIQVHLILSRLFGQLQSSGPLYSLLASVTLLALGHGGPLFD